jgi:hypothetical protein
MQISTLAFVIWNSMSRIKFEFACDGDHWFRVYAAIYVFVSTSAIEADACRCL